MKTENTTPNSKLAAILNKIEIAKNDLQTLIEKGLENSSTFN